jgi:two-component system, NtrC family, sensor kinase
MIKARLFCIPIFLFTISYSFKAHAQINIDSLQKSILESVQQKLDKKGVPKSYLDTNILKSHSPVDLNQIFTELNKSLAIAKSMGDVNKLKGGYYNLSAIDSMRGNYKGAYENYKLYALYRDSLQKKETEKKELQAKMQYEFDKKQAIAKAEQAKKDAEQKRIKNLQYFTIAGLIFLLLVILLIAFIQWRNNNQKKKANLLLQKQNTRVESALSELKSTQAQLIQSEKMASLGELTAGIAHEIQNPLNFVNNFSEVSNEMLDEMKDELNKGDVNEAKIIADDIKQNLEKINHHGKRADAIVKGMLQHSRKSTGVKELTDINALCDEYMRLSYHGLRAKDKSFNADFKTDFDNSIEKINIVAQDIGRVLLNLFNNAFYAVNEKKKLMANGYQPIAEVKTCRIKDKVEIIISDNGNGIPQNIIDKIFQPFFTTKPTGQGTGLGLSLAYDIITKKHNGTIKVESNENNGSDFIITLPA